MYNEKNWGLVTKTAMVTVLIIISLTLGFSSFQDTGIIKDVGASVKANKDIRVTGVSVVNPVSEAVSNYEEYTSNSISSAINLPSANSKLTYKVEVTNFGNVEMYLKEITGLPSNLKYTLNNNNYKLGQMICDDNDSTKCTLASKKTIDITISYKDSASYDSSNTTIPFTLDFTFVPFNKVAQVDTKYYQTLQEAINDCPNNVQTIVILLQNTSEVISIISGKNIVLNLQNNTLSNNGNNPVISNKGTLSISNGTITSNAPKNGTINNESGGVINISGGNIINTGGRQAFYNNKGTATISGNAKFSASTSERAAVQNVAGGTMTILGGTITSTGSNALQNAGTMTIGEKDAAVDKTTPVFKGIAAGIYSTSNFNFYDGIAKGVSSAINGMNKVYDKEEGYSVISSEEDIDGTTYKTAYLGIGKTVTFNPNGGSVTETNRTVEQGSKIGELPEPTRTGYEFDGWFTASTGGDEINKNTMITENVTYYAHWDKVTNIAQIGNTTYGSIKEALDSISGNTQTTINLLRNTSEALIIGENKNVILDLNNNTLSNKGDKAVIENSGALSIVNGTITSNADTGAINNKAGSLTISSGEIIATGSRQAVYITGGTVTITGSAYLSSETFGTPTTTTMERGTVQNISGTLIITGGTIVGNKQQAISNESNLTIGEKDGSINASSPVIRGKLYGIRTTGTLNFYDGIIEGQTDAINGTVSDQEDNTQIKDGSETIDGNLYKTNYLETIQ